MKLRSALWFVFSPLALVGGCLLPSFDNVPAHTEVVGGADTGGSTNVDAGAGGEAPVGGALAGGDGNNPGRALELTPDQYIVPQGKLLKINAASGVLSNDSPNNLQVSAFTDADKARPKAYDAELDIAPNGSITFTPAADFFGRYTAHYTATDAAGQTAMSTVTFVVQPAAVALSAVVDGVGGVLLTGGGKDAVGTALAPLGDVNGDGFDDFAVGASGASGGYGSVYVVFGRADFGALSLGTLATSSTETRFAVLAGSMDAPVSSFVASAGRFDTDKISDILVGSPDADTGRLFVVYGGPQLKTTLTLATMSDKRGVTLSGFESGSRLGLHVSAGDFNGDHKTDLVAGIHPGGSTQGGLCLVLENPVASDSIDHLAQAVVQDSGVFDLPLALGFVGDVTGDGKDDVLASSTRHVALLFGQGDAADVPSDISLVASANLGLLRTRENTATGVAPVAAAGDVNGDKLADFVYCDQFTDQAQCNVFFGPLGSKDTLEKPDWQLAGFASSPALPLLASGADLNQDGFADLVLAEAGAAYVVFGRDAGFGAVDVSSLGTDGFSLGVPKSGELTSVATVGDVNGDGYGDFAVGDPTAGGGVGHVYVVFGGPFSADQR